MIIFLFCGLLAYHHGSYAQKVSASGSSAIPQEKVYVHYNTSLLFVGEYLYYKAYLLNEDASKLSSLSKVAYVELVNKERQPIFKHKLYLENSAGQGDFFIPSDVPSGHYKLIAYTQWMRNGNKENIFQGDISIINPYQSAQDGILAEAGLDSIFNGEKKPSFKASIRNEYDDSSFELTLDKTIYDNRTKVAVGLRKKDGNSMEGTYSMSIRKVDTIAIPSKMSAKRFARVRNQQTGLADRLNDIKFLPELRGELIYGHVEAKNQDLSNKEVNVAISLPEEEGFQLKVVTTDADGNFIANLDKEYSAKEMHLQVLGESRQEYSVSLNEVPPLGYPKMSFNGVAVTPNMEKMIVERSVHNQIENGYFVVKPDSLVPLPIRFPFKKKTMTIYDLDDYTRFSTIHETLVEVVDLVWTKRMGENQSLFQVLPYQYDYQLTNLLPLVLMDGIPVQDHNQLAEYNARDVQRIAFIRDKYVIGPKIFQGVLNFETIDRDYRPHYLGNHSIVVNMVPPEPHKKYYHQKYDGADAIADQLLDYRYQLLWEPNLKIDEEKIEFYTSDLEGAFEIVIEGFTKEGSPVSARKILDVK